MTSTTPASVVSRWSGRALDWLLSTRRASYGLAIMRIGYGTMSLILMLMYLPSLSYYFGRASTWANPLRSVSPVNEYPWPILDIFPRGASDTQLFVTYALLGIVTVMFILGWRMRIVAPVFALMWLSFTTISPMITNSGHYATFRVMLIFMIFTDLSRRWSLDAVRRRRAIEAGRTPGSLLRIPEWFTNLTNNAGVVLIGFQLCTIYVVSAIWKLHGSTWRDGTAVYYPLRVDELTIFPELSDLVWQITPIVFLASWMSVFGQLLFPVLLLNRWTRIGILIVITGMHVGIGILLALPFFSAVMLFADAIFIRESTWTWARAKARALWDRLRRRDRPSAPDATTTADSGPEPSPAPAETREPVGVAREADLGRRRHLRPAR